MKSSLSILFVIVFAFQSVHSQEIETSTEKSQQEMYDVYSLKHKKLKKTGLILLGAGAGAMLTGTIIAATSDSWGGVGSGAIVMTAGLMSTIASIPVLIVANSKKRKAAVILGSGKIGMQGLGFDNSSYVSTGLKISF